MGIDHKAAVLEMAAFLSIFLENEREQFVVSLTKPKSFGWPWKIELSFMIYLGLNLLLNLSSCWGQLKFENY